MYKYKECEVFTDAYLSTTFKNTYTTNTLVSDAVSRFSKLNKRQREAIALLDAAADENGRAFIAGIGDCRLKNTFWPRYWLDRELVKNEVL